MTSVANEGRMAEVARALRDADSIALACHIGPDGDALGSMLALGLAARNEGKKTVASFGSPFEVPDNLAFLPTQLLVEPGDFPESPEVMVVLDAGSADRLGELAPKSRSAETLIVLDHHATNEGFGDIAVVDPTSAATGELVLELLDVLGWEISPPIANALMTALMTDTGRFQYTNTTPLTFQMAGRLVELGAQPSEIARHVYEEAPFGYLKVLSSAMSRAELNEDLGVVSTFVTHTDLVDAGIDWGDVDKLIDTLRLAAEADVAVLAKQHADNRTKVSLRSRGDTDVGSLAASFGGGGHRLASGFTFDGAAAKALEQTLSKVGAHQ